MQNMQRICSLLKTMFQIGFILLLAIFLIAWGAVISGDTVMLHDKWLHFFGALFSNGMNLVILFYVIKLFSSYEKNEIFTLNNIYVMRNIGYLLLAKELILPLYHFIFFNFHFDVISITGIYISNFEMIFLAFIIIINSWVMRNGYQLREQQQLTI